MTRLTVLGALGALAAAGAVTVGAGPGGARAGGPAAYTRLADVDAGYTLIRPRSWRAEGRVLSTSFGAGAACRSVRVVDREPPAGSGGGAGGVLQTLVQLCARPLERPATSLEEFLRRTYPPAVRDRFAPTRLAGLMAFRSGDAADGLVLLQTRSHRIEVATAVVADDANRERRLAQVRRILRSLAVLRPALAPARAPARVAIGSTAGAHVLVDAAGRSLYLSTGDARGRSRCTGACAAAWRPLLTRGQPRGGRAVRRGLLGRTPGSGGRRQVTYAGHPLYRYVGDRRPGERFGQDVADAGGAWYLVSARGAAVTP
jgi:predicted lipoprotein with Yx(FWY)xxD motif